MRTTGKDVMTSSRACCIATGRLLTPQGNNDRGCWTLLPRQGCQVQAQIVAAAPAIAVSTARKLSAQLLPCTDSHTRWCWSCVVVACVAHCPCRSSQQRNMFAAQRQGAEDGRCTCVALCLSTAALSSRGRLLDGKLTCIAIGLCCSFQCQELVCPRRLHPLCLLGRGAGWHVYELLVGRLAGGLGQGRPVPHNAAAPQLLAAIRGRGFCRAAWQ